MRDMFYFIMCIYTYIYIILSYIYIYIFYIHREPNKSQSNTAAGTPKLSGLFSPDTPQLQGLLVLLVHESSPRELSTPLSFTTISPSFTPFPLSLRSRNKGLNSERAASSHPFGPSFQHVEGSGHLIQPSLGEAVFPHPLGMLSQRGRLQAKHR